jgi:hypothetical protein
MTHVRTASALLLVCAALVWPGAPLLAQAPNAPAPPAANAPAAPAPENPSAQPPGADQSPLKPGSVRVTTRAPEPEKWLTQNDVKNKRRLFRCKPLACADKVAVLIAVSNSPTRHPNPQALEKFAKIDLPKSIRAGNAAREIMSDGTDKVETLVSETANLKGYPAVSNETKYIRGSTAVYAITAIIFAGPVMVNVRATSPDLAVAQQYLKAFLDATDIKEGPPLPPGAPAPVPAGPAGKSQNI